MATSAQRLHLEHIMARMEYYRTQLAYPPADDRGPLDAATFKMSEQQAEHVLANQGRLTFDCSEAVTVWCKWAGLSDPNGLNYRYCGYTGTMLNHLPHFREGHYANIGAIVVFGPGTGHHCAMVCVPDYEHGNPVCTSHGRPGLDVASVSEIAKTQPPGITYLSILHL
jgi:hypothetical protein